MHLVKLEVDDTLDVMYRIVLDEEFFKLQATEMAASVKHHTFQHIKLLCEELIKSPLSDEQRKEALDIFIEEFLKKMGLSVHELQAEGQSYIDERLNEFKR